MSTQHKPLIMPVECFRFMIRKQYWQLQMDNDIVDEIGRDFSDYMHENCKPETIKKIVPESPYDVIANMDNPLRTNGFHSGLIMHFLNFVDERGGKS